MASIHTNTFASLAGKVTGTEVGLLGYVVWHVLPDVRITPSDLAALAAAHRVDDAPVLGNAADAFRRATSPMQRSAEGRRTRYLVRPVCDTGDELVRHVVVETVDAKNVSLGHKAVAEMRFVRKSESFVSNWIGQCGTTDDTVQVDEIMRAAERNYHEFRTSLTGPELTRFVMRTLDEKMSHVTVHPRGAVYFVPASYRERLNRLRDFVQALAPYVKTKGEEPVLQVVPVIDIPDQRQMVQRGLSSGVQVELAQLSADIAEMLGRNAKPDVESVAHKAGLAAAMRAKVAEYEALLGTTLAELTAGIDILDSQIGSLSAKANSSDAFIAMVEAEDIPVSWNEARSRASIKFGLRAISVSFSKRGWTLKFKSSRLGDLKARPECTKHDDTYTVTTPDPDVAMLFVRRVFSLPAPV